MNKTDAIDGKNLLIVGLPMFALECKQHKKNWKKLTWKKENVE